MDRKDFMKACGGAVVGGLAVRLPLSAALPKGGAASDATPRKELVQFWQFYGTGDGKIFMRKRVEDAWALHANFGPEYGIHSIYRSGADVLADVSHKNQPTFTLKLSADGQSWLHVGK